MKNNKFLIATLVFGIVAVSVSFVYYFIVRPLNKDAKLQNCLQEAEKVVGVDRIGEKIIKKSDTAKDYCFKLY